MQKMGTSFFNCNNCNCNASANHQTSYILFLQGLTPIFHFFYQAITAITHIEKAHLSTFTCQLSPIYDALPKGLAGPSGTKILLFSIISPTFVTK